MLPDRSDQDFVEHVGFAGFRVEGFYGFAREVGFTLTVNYVNVYYE